MKSFLFDANIYSYAMQGLPGPCELFRSCERPLFSPVVIGELMSGFKKGTAEQRNLMYLRRFLSEPRVAILEITEETAEWYAFIYHQLRSEGTPIPTNDIWIAASALQHGAPLATMDQHFKKISGLRIVEPSNAV